VVNVDVSKDAEVHVHRIGRTGRVDASGLALSLCAPNEKKWVRAIEEYQDKPASWYKLDDLGDSVLPAEPAPMVTLIIAGGKKDKLRPGDVLGALTGDAGLLKDQVGKINVTEFQTYVALARDVADAAYRKLNAGNKLGPDFGNFKGRSFKMRFLDV
jgi:ATP-independent RNA helicase DbpA